MGAQTEVLKLYMPGGGSLSLGGADEVLDIDKLNQNSQKIDAFAKGWGVPAERNQQFYGLAAGLSVLTGMKRGDTYQESDGDKRLWRFDGLNWVTGENGMFLIRPTAVTGAGVSIAADGSIKFDAVPAGAESLLQGLFSDSFENYQLRVRIPAKQNGGSLDCNGIVGTSAVTSPNHFRVVQSYTNGARSDGQVASTTSFGEILSSIVGTNTSAVVDVFTPNAAEDTHIISSQVARGGATSTAHLSSSLDTKDKLTGLRIKFPSGATTTGSIRVYGLK